MILPLCAAMVLLITLVVTTCCVWTATRLDRLQRRCESAEAALRTHLTHRATITWELARSGLADSASTSALLVAAGRVRDGDAEGEWTGESDLSRALQRVELPGPDEEPLVILVMESQRRASVARRIHNDGAALAAALHRQRRVRWFGLAGRSSPPAMIEFDDGMR